MLYNFTGGADGGYIDWDRLAFDANGNLYGVTVFSGNYGQGVVFKLTPNPDGSWTESVLHQFTGGKDGAEPRTTPIFDAAGNLYGSVAYGGAHGCGAIFRLTPGADGQWTYRVIHQFADTPACSPWVGLIFDTAGSLYGTTRNQVGGCSNPPQECGTVFKLTLSPDGKWTYKVLHKFSGGRGGADPSVSGLVFDEAGTLYGTTEDEGASESGIFFKLTPDVSDKWTFKILHQFSAKRDGRYPNGQVTRDSPGNLYGTACLGGPHGDGTIFKMAPNPDGTWTFSVLYAFGGSDGDSPSPGGGLIQDAAGNFYGTTVVGGAYGHGTVFEITP